MIFLGIFLLVVGVLVLILVQPRADARKALWVIIAIGAALVLAGALGAFTTDGVR